MNTQKILASEISELKISSLPSRPTAPTSFGGRGFTSREMKEAFDKLPLLIIERFNTLLDDISSSDENSLSAAISTGLSDGHTLKNLFSDITNGALAEILTVNEAPLSEHLAGIGERMSYYDDAINNYPQTVFSSGGTIHLEKGKIYRMDTVSTLSLVIPEDPDDEFFCELTFDSNEDAASFSVSSPIRFSGDDIADESFYPKENTHYTVFIWYDGSMQGVVRGLANA